MSWAKPLALLLAIGMAMDRSWLVLAQETSREAGPSEQAGLVIVVGGVGGLDIIGPCAETALPRAGVKHEVREFVWTHGWGQIIKDLQDTRHQCQKAAELARIITTWLDNNPGRPVFLVGKSGGTGLVIMTAEMLPGNTLERIILLSAAVAPHHDLRRALRATRHEIVSFHSHLDQLWLNWGTSQFGTMDRYYGPSAGVHGFRVPADLDEEGGALYRRLVQVSYQARMLRCGHVGSHAGTSFPGFLSAEVAPWLR
jgi:pimeloyl-ACP methyl ester carboxylesterase